MERRAYIASIDCIDIDNPECLCDACKHFFENGFIEIPLSESKSSLKSKELDLENIKQEDKPVNCLMSLVILISSLVVIFLTIRSMM
jgi:hypothetical protein